MYFTILCVRANACCRDDRENLGGVDDRRQRRVRRGVQRDVVLGEAPVGLLVVDDIGEEVVRRYRETVKGPAIDRDVELARRVRV